MDKDERLRALRIDIELALIDIDNGLIHSAKNRLVRALFAEYHNDKDER